MPTLHAFGCSYSTGLNKFPDPKNNGYRGTYVKPYVKYLADELGLRLKNHARDGNSNPVIYTSIKLTEIKPDDLVLVCWSGLLRQWLWLRKHSGNIGFFKPPPKNPPPPFSENESYYMSELSIRAAHNYLTSNGIRFKMISAFVNPPFKEEEIWSNWIESDKSNNTLLDICTDRWCGVDYARPIAWDHHNEDQTSLLNGCKHPNARGHKVIAKTLLPYFKENYSYA